MSKGNMSFCLSCIFYEGNEMFLSTAYLICNSIFRFFFVFFLVKSFSLRPKSSRWLCQCKENNNMQRSDYWWLTEATIKTNHHIVLFNFWCWSNSSLRIRFFWVVNDRGSIHPLAISNRQTLEPTGTTYAKLWLSYEI